MLDFLGIGSKEKLAEGKRKIKIKYITFIEWVILFFIAFTSVSVVYLTVPIFLTVVFLLLQIKKYVSYKINKPYLTEESLIELIQKEIKKNG